ncbi:Rhomboid-type serine protease 2 [Cladobotryum mycophilum]|uniref:Rhomboid-type serine protease n=1 Tax=Cladobotryum mycophilum TaxID=491253 RepID=A0ABR0SMA5_9HYPO
MAANDYYYGSSQQPPATHPSSAPYYDSTQAAPSPHPTPAPSYHTGYHDTSPYGGPSIQPPPRTNQSPFDTVFDDNAYPMNSRLHGGGASSSDISQQGVYQDTGYYGGSRTHMTDDIPLQDRAGKGPEMNDHIYDAPVDAAQPTRQRDARGKVRIGELGMLGSNKKRIPWVVYIFSLAQLAVFIAEVVKNGILTGSPIMIKPQFNPMIGPSTQVLINMGARYAPCMHNIKEIQGRNATDPVWFLCPNATKNTEICPLSQLCGFGGGVPDPVFDGDASQSPRPNQWYRFIIPIFMHAGIIHIGFNLLLQMTIGKEMEMAIGSIRFFLVYMSAGIFGFVMGGNFAAPGIASTGASGSLFGIIALTLLDLLYSWKDRKSPIKDLLFIVLDMVIAFVLGLLPGLDNFSHIGGFLTGLTVGICVLHSPNSLRRRLGQDTSYSAVDPGAVPFYKSPIGFFKGRKPLWWAWWLVRVAALILIVVVFIVLLNNFYKVDGNKCSWCKYLSCIPVNNWCDLGQIKDQ